MWLVTMVFPFVRLTMAFCFPEMKPAMKVVG
jgi:hypothetical protein